LRFCLDIWNNFLVFCCTWFSECFWLRILTHTHTHKHIHTSAHAHAKCSFAVSLLCLAFHSVHLRCSPRCCSRQVIEPVQIRWNSRVFFPLSWGRWPSLIKQDRFPGCKYNRQFERKKETKNFRVLEANLGNFVVPIYFRSSVALKTWQSENADFVHRPRRVRCGRVP